MYTACRWLQEAFNVPCVIQMTDDEKFLWKGGDLENYRRLTVREDPRCPPDPARRDRLVSEGGEVMKFYSNDTHNRD